MNYVPINFAEKYSLFFDTWSPRIIAEMNDYQIKIAKIQGEFVWHQHAKTDEVFIVIQGEMIILFHDGQVTLQPGELFVVPKGVEHKPCAEYECNIMLIEPCGVVNTGHAAGKLTAENDVWV